MDASLDKMELENHELKKSEQMRESPKRKDEHSSKNDEEKQRENESLKK